MSWSDFTEMLALAAQEPAVVAIAALCVFAAGMLAGVSARRRDEEPTDAGDTHIGMPPLPTVRRVRAGPPRPTLKPSYDGRKANPQGLAPSTRNQESTHVH